jgi:hypothetical protein
MPHAVASAAAGANDVSVSVLCQGFELFTNCGSQNTLVDIVASHHRFNRKDAIVSIGTWKAIGRGLASVANATSCACVQCPTASIRNKKIQKFILRALWSISTNKSFPLYCISHTNVWIS